LDPRELLVNLEVGPAIFLQEWHEVTFEIVNHISRLNDHVHRVQHEVLTFVKTRSKDASVLVFVILLIFSWSILAFLGFFGGVLSRLLFLLLVCLLDSKVDDDHWHRVHLPKFTF
jgi:hypothetical protein